MQELAELNTRFAQNVLADEAGFTLALQGPADLAGLPAWLVASAQAAAEQRGQAGHVVTLSRSLVVPFLTFSTRRHCAGKPTGPGRWPLRAAGPARGPGCAHSGRLGRHGAAPENAAGGATARARAGPDGRARC
ncbi:MAG TPA: hypothetical protein VFL86_22240 [Burkholderiaceae bacterium]|nr:hypothetical protein [Burkholderiaceae bacterium]